MRNNPAQFSLRALLFAIACLAVVFALYAQDNGHVLFFPLAAFALVLAGAFPKRSAWRHAFWTWAAVAGIAALVDLELASLFGANVPIIGRMPGPPSRIAEILIRFGIGLAIVWGLWQSFLGVKSGKRLAREVCGISGLVLLAPAWLLVRENGPVTVAPVAAIILLIAAAFGRRVDLHHAFWSWVSVMGIAALVDLELASRNRWIVPNIGRMPGPPSRTAEGLVVIAIWVTIALGIWQAVAGVRSARLLSRVACWIAGFALIAAILYMLVFHFNGPALALTIGTFALIAAGSATRAWLCRNRSTSLN